MTLTRQPRPPIVWALSGATLAYAAVALGAVHAWLSGAGALVVTWLLWRRHPRARFAAYVLFSVVALRSVWTRDAWSVFVAVVAILALQLPAARRAWPRIGATAGGR